MNFIEIIAKTSVMIIIKQIGKLVQRDTSAKYYLYTYL